MEEFVLMILNAIIIFFTLKYLIKITKKKIQNCNNINKRQKIEYKIGGCISISLSIINLWVTTLGEFRVISYILFILTVGYIIFIGALTKDKYKFI